MAMFTSLRDYAVRVIFIVTFPKALFIPMGEVEVSEGERKVLNKDFVDVIWQSNFSKSFLVWRRRLLYSASFFLALGACIQIFNIRDQSGSVEKYTNATGDDETSTRKDEEKYTVLGAAAVASQKLAPFCSLAVTMVAALFWTSYTKSRNVLVPGWLLTLLLSLWPTMVPLDYTLKETTYSNNIFQGAAYAFSILPTYLSIIAGLTLGSKRVFQFVPSPLSGAMIVLSAVFAIITPFAALALIVQVFGDLVLVSGICFLVLGPVIIVSFTSHFTAVSTFGSTKKIELCNRLLTASGLCRGIGMLIVVGWVISVALQTDFDDEGEQALGTYMLGLLESKSLAGMTLEFLGAMMFNAVLWTDIAVHVCRNDDIKMQKLQSDIS